MSWVDSYTTRSLERKLKMTCCGSCIKWRNFDCHLTTWDSNRQRSGFPHMNDPGCDKFKSRWDTQEVNDELLWRKMQTNLEVDK